MNQNPRGMDSINLSIIESDFKQARFLDESMGDMGSIVGSNAPQTTAQRLRGKADKMQSQNVAPSPKIPTKTKALATTQKP